MKRTDFALFGFLILSLIAGASAKTITVCPGGCNATTAQGGIGLASLGDTVSLSYGTLYIENISVNVTGVTLDGNGAMVFAPGGTAVSAVSPNVIVQNIRVNNAPRGMYVNASNVTLRNVTLDHIHDGLYWNTTTSASILSVLANDSRITFENVVNGSVRDSVFLEGFSGLSLTTSDNFLILNNTFDGSAVAISLDGSDNNTITATAVQSADGLRLSNSSNNTVDSMTVYGGGSGLWISDSSNTTVRNSVFAENSDYDVTVFPYTPEECVITFTNVSTTGLLPFVYRSDATPVVNTTASEIFLCDADGVSVTNSTVNGSLGALGTGIILYFTDGATLDHVNSSFSTAGIAATYSNTLTVRNSFFMQNGILGITATGGEDFLITNVTILDSGGTGINFDLMNRSSIIDSTITEGLASINLQNGVGYIVQNTTLTGAVMEGIYANSITNSSISNNTITGTEMGLYFDTDATGNTILNNFLNATYPALTDGIVTNTWNRTPLAATNIIGGPYLAGNFYAQPDGAGFSETCTDTNLDELCDANYTIDAGNIDFKPLARIHADADGDGIIDEADGLTGNVSNITVTGGTANLTIGNGTLGTNVTGVQPVVIAVNNSPVLNFTFNFSAHAIDFSRVAITVATDGVVINMSGQLLSGETKTIFITDNGFTDLCVKDADVASLADISADCTGVSETDFSDCVGVAGGTTHGNITCYDEGPRLRIEGLTHSAILGSVVTHSSSSHSSGGGGGGGGGGFIPPSCGDGSCSSDETCTTCAADCGVCPGPTVEAPIAPAPTAPAVSPDAIPSIIPQNPYPTLQTPSTPRGLVAVFWVATIALLGVFATFLYRQFNSGE